MTQNVIGVCPDCSGQISQNALFCPHCGAPGKRGMHLFGYEFKSKASIAGIPLVHIATGIDPATGRKRIAKGIIAIGDIAFGGLAIGECQAA